MTTCASCATENPPTAKFCNECASPVNSQTKSAEYKQVTVLFADVVHSIDIASAVGAERLREVMADLADRCVAVVKHFGGMVDKFTGDGIMAVFSAPVALEDHAVRACLAALKIREEAKRLAVDVHARDGTLGLMIQPAVCRRCQSCVPRSRIPSPHPLRLPGVESRPPQGCVSAHASRDRGALREHCGGFRVRLGRWVGDPAILMLTEAAQKAIQMIEEALWHGPSTSLGVDGLGGVDVMPYRPRPS